MRSLIGLAIMTALGCCLILGGCDPDPFPGGGGGLEAPSARPRIDPPSHRQRAGQGSRRTPKRRWSQRVFQAINLDGG